MKTKIYLLFLLNVFVFGASFSQTKKKSTTPDSVFFNYAYWNGVADKGHYTAEEREALISEQKKIFLEESTHNHQPLEELEWVKLPQQQGQKKGYSQNVVNAACSNIDFELGNFSSWVQSSGFTKPIPPAVNNTFSTTPTPTYIPQFDQGITSGAGTDFFGGFPVVYPGGGNFSYKLGSTNVGGKADRIEQTFSVTAANANFTYRYALVLEDGRHTVAEQPKFTSEIIDAGGNVVNCTKYTFSAGSGITGFSTSAQQNNGNTVIYKPWTDVAVDLTPNIGQNVTIRFTTYDCSPSGHFAYAYIDAVCSNFETSVADTTCPGIPVPMCAPAGFLSTTWNGPGVVNNPNQCILAATPGTYSCSTFLSLGCPGPTFVHTLSVRPSPLIGFTPLTTGSCSPQFTFNSFASISTPYTISSYSWSYGDGSGSTIASNPVHTYTAPGTYTVIFTATSNKGCTETVASTITVNPLPILAFSPPSGCQNTVTQFTNNSTIASPGTISSYTWNFFGNAPNSNVISPQVTYTASGIYTINLSATSNLGCVSSLTQTLSINPAPSVDFLVSNLCDVNGTSFTPSVTTGIITGTISQYFWDFGDGGTSTSPTPIHTYTAPGTYSVSFSAISNHNCPAATGHTFMINPSPNMAIITNSVNACTRTFTFVSNSTISAGFMTYTWNISSGVTSTNNIVPVVFPAIGNYVVSLIGVSDQGCQDTAIANISIFDPPVLSLSAPASCNNASITVNTAVISGVVTSYLWDFGDPLSGANNTSTLQSPTHYYSGISDYPVTLNLVSNLNCTATQSLMVSVNPDPVASILLGPVPDNCSTLRTFSSTSSVTNAPSATVPSSVTAYSWAFQSAGVSTLSAPSANFPGIGTYSVSLIVSTNHNCKDTASMVVQIHPSPVVDFTVKSGCGNVLVNLPSTTTIAAFPGAPSIASYTWDYGDGTFATTATSTPHSYTLAGTHTLSFGATSNMGCSAVMVKPFTIYPVPTIDFSVADLCFGDGSQFTSTINVVPLSNIYGADWNFGDGSQIVYGNNVTHTYSTVGNFAVNFSVTTNNECTVDLTKTITINPLPSASFTVNSGCLGITSNFASTSTISNTPANSLATYTYAFGDGTFNSSPVFGKVYATDGVFTPSLTVTSNFGCKHTAVNTLTIHPLPTPTFVPAEACEGSPVPFVATPIINAPGSIVSYTWNFGNGNTSNLQNPGTFTFAVPPALPFQYTVSLASTSDMGCINTVANTLTIHPLPSTQITPLGNSCHNNTISINTNQLITQGSITSLTLSFGDGNLVTVPNPSGNFTTLHSYNAHNTPQIPTYSINLSVTSDAGCVAVDTETIIIYPNPFVNFIASNFCYGSQTAFTSSVTIPAPYTIANYFWEFGDGSATGIVTGSATTHQYVGPNVFGTYPVSLTAVSFPEGPTSTLQCSLTAVKNVTVFPRPATSFTASTVCLGSTTSFTNLTPPANIVGWSWYHETPGVLTAVGFNSTYNYTSTSTTYSPVLIALNSYGCSKDTMITVDLYENPISSFTTANVCFGAQSIFVGNTIFPEGTAANYIWTIGTNTIASGLGAQNSSTILSAPGTYSVSLNSISDLGCSHIVTKTVTVYPLPNINITANEACLNSPTQFTNQTSGFNNTYQWTFGDPASGGANTSTLSNPSHIYSSNTSYVAQLQALSDQNCPSSATISVLVHNKPFASFTNSVICAGDKVNFSNLSTSNDGTLSMHFWDFNGDNISDNELMNPIHTYTLDGNQQVKLVVYTQYGCSDDTTGLVFVNPKATAAFESKNKSGCPTLCVDFKNLSTIKTGSFTTSWDFGDDSPVNTFESPSHCYESGSYDVKLTLVSNVGCVTNFIHPGFVSVYPVPTAGFKVEPEEVDEDEPVITVSSEASQDANFVKYFISDGSSFGSPRFTHYIKNLKQTKPMIVQIVKNQYGCVDTLFKTLNIKPAYLIYFPNVFTPNGDGTNDHFVPKGVGITKFTMTVYDRWGHKVFTTNEFTDTWDGSPKSGSDSIKEDVYTWRAQVTDVFGKNHFLVGHVTVLR